jgi:translation initiation factor 2 subunit 2
MARYDDEGVGFDMVGSLDRMNEKQKTDIAKFETQLRTKKRKPKRADRVTMEGTTTSITGESKQDEGVSSETTESLPAVTRQYPYTALLDRIFGELDTVTRPSSHKLPPPKVGLHGSKRTGWSNFMEICHRLERSPDHVQLFFLTEMNTTGNLDGNKSLIIRGRWKPKHVESLLKKYIGGYVTCGNCRSPKTTLKKDKVTRLHIMKCTVCSATRSVPAIKAGFHATTRDERRAARNSNR